MAELKIAVPEDFPALSRLWQAVFGDGGDFIGRFFDLLWTPGCCRAVIEDGEAAAMGFCLRGARAAGYSCGYIYAMATLPERRGGGLAAAIGRALIEDAYSDGVDIISTLPAERSLNAWYESRLGMTPVFRKGGEGVVFPQSWLDFAKLCGGHDPNTPERLLAVSRDGHILHEVMGMGWEHTFD